jgi:type II secretory pathway predicted ATPase ExeA
VTIDRLRAHWGLTRMPFSKDLAPSMLHTHRSHAEAAARISWCVEERAIGLVTGEVGAGKSVAVRAALSGLDASRHTVIYLGNPSVGTRGLYSTIVTTLGGTPRFHRASLIPQAAEALATEEDERGRRVVLVLDEAHLLDGDQLEGLRMLTNVDIDSRSPFACLLVGQPTLRRRIRLGAFAALDQRVALRYSMAGMDAVESRSLAGTTPSSPTTPWLSCTRCHGACPGQSTTWPCSPWSPPSPRTSRSWTNPQPGRR